MAMNALGVDLEGDQATAASGLIEKLTERLAAVDIEKRDTLDRIQNFLRTRNTVPLVDTCSGNIGIEPPGGEDRLQSLLSQKALQLGKLKAWNVGYEGSIHQYRTQISQINGELAEESKTIQKLQASVNERLHLLWPWQQQQLELARRAEISAELQQQLEQQVAEASKEDEAIENMHRTASVHCEELAGVAAAECSMKSMKLVNEAPVVQAELQRCQEEIAQNKETISGLCERSEALKQDLRKGSLSAPLHHAGIGALHQNKAKELQQVKDTCKRLAMRVDELSKCRDEEAYDMQTVEELRRQLEEQRSILKATNSNIQDLKCQLVDVDQDYRSLCSELAISSEHLKRLKHEQALWKKHKHQIGSIKERVSALAGVCQLQQGSAQWSIETAVSGIFQELGFGEDAAELSIAHGALSSLILASSVEAAVAKVQDEVQLLVPHVLHAIACVESGTDWREAVQSPPAELKKRRSEVPSVREALLDIWKALPKCTSKH
eukprot:gnl/MRDRNA2_/MRDRNA2_98750_c0_seq1.p1 gnl/MRDRNA2_/MRDRNA2_98750_c0~~gnl/MRDRNA2_/MRDRNA2_98750_c0_seq1.p1  ORF type:complete len:509 (-),score=141.51 gnl/MRDRNA2_/MRDRNA2_98750_c0_seq1:66-1547(-)